MPKKDINNKTWVHVISGIDEYTRYPNSIAVSDFNSERSFNEFDRLVSYDEKDTIDVLARKTNVLNPLFNAVYNSLTDDIGDICSEPDDECYETGESEYYYGTSWFKSYIRAIRFNGGGTVGFSCRRYYRRKSL